MYGNHGNSSFTHVVVGVQNTRNILRQVSVQHSLDVTADIDCEEEQFHM